MLHNVNSTLGQEPVSIIYYTKPWVSINCSTKNWDASIGPINLGVDYPEGSHKISLNLYNLVPYLTVLYFTTIWIDFFYIFRIEFAPLYRACKSQLSLLPPSGKNEWNILSRLEKMQLQFVIAIFGENILQ